jgi:hypothetical protein
VCVERYYISLAGFSLSVDAWLLFLLFFFGDFGVGKGVSASLESWLEIGRITMIVLVFVLCAELTRDVGVERRWDFCWGLYDEIPFSSLISFFFFSSCPPRISNPRKPQ